MAVSSPRTGLTPASEIAHFVRPSLMPLNRPPKAATCSSATRKLRRPEPGTHNGGGETVGYSFFAKTPNSELVFRKRAFKPGSGIGYHEQKEDEIYYVLSGRGVMTIDDKSFEVTPGHRSAHAGTGARMAEAGRHRMIS